MYTTILIGLTIPLIAAMRKQSWTADMMPAIVFGVLVIAYIGGQYLDGVPFALSADYLRGFVLALGAQQGIHRLVRNTSWFQALEAVGNTPSATRRTA